MFSPEYVECEPERLIKVTETYYLVVAIVDGIRLYRKVTGTLSRFITFATWHTTHEMAQQYCLPGDDIVPHVREFYTIGR